MTIFRTVSVAVIASILITALPGTTWAGDETNTPVSVNLRAAIDRAAAQTLAEESRDVTPHPISQPAARARQAGGGGGGGASMMVWTLVGTVSSLAATYFIVKEMKKQSDVTAAGQ